MSSATFVGNVDSSGPPGFCPAPPPPPPPPVPGQMPVMRINTAETPMSKRPMIKNNDPYEPPAAIQNAMMTKDKKPFTYTPGMGGKLDLSQIRSPRMARRVAKNANDEGIEGPPKSPLASEQPRPVSTGANLFIQPQVAVPVFPINIPPTSQVVRPPQINRTPSIVSERNNELTRPTVKIEQKLPSQPTTPDTPTTPPQITLAKAPTPWLQNKNKPQDELPEWAKRSTTNGSSTAHSPPESPGPSVQTIYIQQPPSPQVIQSPSARPVPQRVNQQIKPVQPPSERIIPMLVEDRPSVFSVKNEPGHHQLKQTTPHHQQRWGQPGASSQPQSPPINKIITNPPKTQPTSSPGTYIVPIVVEGSNDKAPIINNNPYQQSSPAQNQINRNVQRTPTQQESGPVQSRSFRVLQKITDTDGDDVDNEQFRKLQLTEDDKILMNKFKEHVDGDNYLHQEEDPRYRGAAIPSRAFRYLQNMTDSNEVPANQNAAPRVVNSALKRQNRNSRSFEEAQANLPPSEQQVQEPKKYTGSAIPSRSFRILQAMTTPETAAKQENRQADITYHVESSMMPQGNQHGVFIPHYSHHPIYWAYCPISYPPLSPNQINNHLNYHPINNNIQMSNINDSLVQYDNQDINTSSSIANNLMPYTLYPIYNQHFYPTINNNLHQEQQQQQHQQQQFYCNNILPQPTWIGTINEIKNNNSNSSQPSEINSNEIQGNSSYSSQSSQNNEEEIEENWNKIGNASLKNSEVSSLNIIHEEPTNQSIKQNNSDEADRSTNDENIHTDSDESSSDGTSESLSISNPQNNNEITNTNDKTNELSNSESDSDSYLAYSTGLNPRTNNNPDNSTIINNELEDKQNTDCESDIEDEEEEEDIKEVNIAVKQNDESRSTPNEIDSMGWKYIVEEENEPPDYNETTINIRLPLRLKCSTINTDDKTNGNDVTKSIIKSNEDNIAEDITKNPSNDNDICVNLKIPNETDTSVNFTLKKNFTTMRPMSWCPNDIPTSDTTENCDRAISPSFNCQSTIDDESIPSENNQEEICTANYDKIMTDEMIKEIPQLEVTVEEEDRNKIVINDEELLQDESKKNKCLLTVQNSREETDDEDSGVTSDMSRLISEVDTDSECGPSLRKVNTYKRTQTHSRLFKLLNDEFVATEGINNSPEKFNRKNRLSLPLKQSNGFNYDCSNYSSGIASPDYSPVQDPPACKRSNKSAINNQIKNTDKEQCYRLWKKQKELSTNAVTSFTSKLTQAITTPQSWPFKSNVLCPRIKSSKSVPKTIQNRIKKNYL